MNKTITTFCTNIITLCNPSPNYQAQPVPNGDISSLLCNAYQTVMRLASSQHNLPQKIPSKISSNNGDFFQPGKEQKKVIL